MANTDADKVFSGIIFPLRNKKNLDKKNTALKQFLYYCNYAIFR